MKDPEKIGLSESVAEGLEDMLVAVGKSTQKLELLLKFFSDIFDLAKPYSNEKTGEILAPNKRIPIEKLDSKLRKNIDLIDSAFVETMAYTQWLSIFADSYKKIKKRLAQVRTEGLGERLR